VPGEWTSNADIATGVDVMTETVLRLDRFLVGLAGERGLEGAS